MMEEDTAPELIPAFQDRIKEISAMLANNLSLSALYINYSRINKIEGFCGKKMYLEITRKIQETILAMEGRQIRSDDIIVANSAGTDEFTIFLSGKRDKKDFCSSDLETLCERITTHLNQQVLPITFPYLRGTPRYRSGMRLCFTTRWCGMNGF